MTELAEHDDWDAHWARYSDAASLNPAQMMRHELVLDALRLDRIPIDRLLDVGSGQGDFLSRALQRGVANDSMLAFRVGRVQGLAQSLGKLGHEDAAQEPTCMWTLPAAFPMMGAISLAARVFDRTMPDPTEALSFLVLARPKRRT